VSVNQKYARFPAVRKRKVFVLIYHTSYLDFANRREQGLSTYYATYLHLAMRQGCPLAITDELLRQAATEQACRCLKDDYHVMGPRFTCAAMRIIFSAEYQGRKSG
jgi:hypothetical protein